MNHHFAKINFKETIAKINGLGIPIKLFVDFSALGHRVAYSCKDELLKTGFTDWRVWKYFFLEHIIQLKQKLNRGSEIVLCCDRKINGEYWRMKVYPDYKKMRDKKQPGIPKEFIFENFNKFQAELRDFFPFKIIEVPGAEGDDVIAVLVRESVDYANIIMSSDFDLYQLTDNKQNFFFSLKHDFFVDGGDAKEHLLEKICGGDSSDNIPNILSDLDAISDPLKRQKSLTKIRFTELKESYVKNGEEGFISQLDEKVKVRYQENKTLMDLTQIPSHISEAIKITYNDTVIKGTANTAWSYCITNSMVDHVNKIGTGVFN